MVAARALQGDQRGIHSRDERARACKLGGHASVATAEVEQARLPSPGALSSHCVERELEREPVE